MSGFAPLPPTWLLLLLFVVVVVCSPKNVWHMQALRAQASRCADELVACCRSAMDAALLQSTVVDMSTIPHLPCLPTWNGWLLEYAVRLKCCLLPARPIVAAQVVYCVTEYDAVAAARALSLQASILCRLCAQRDGASGVEELVAFAVPSGVAEERGCQGVVQAWTRVFAQRATGVYSGVSLLEEPIGMKPVAL